VQWHPLQGAEARKLQIHRCIELRIFTHGTSKDGESYLGEWNESEGAFKWMYSGLWNWSSEMVNFDTTKNRFLAAGDEYQIMFCDKNNINIFSTTVTESCLLGPPLLSFNKEGSLQAITSRDNGINILSILHSMLENRGVPPESVITQVQSQRE
jgi:hypothetical protein